MEFFELQFINLILIFFLYSCTKKRWKLFLSIDNKSSINSCKCRLSIFFKIFKVR